MRREGRESARQECMSDPVEHAGLGSHPQRLTGHEKVSECAQTPALCGTLADVRGRAGRDKSSMGISFAEDSNHGWF